MDAGIPAGIHVEVYADVLCPWCYIGKRRMSAALEGIPAAERPRIVWRSFELAPDAGRTPGPTAAEAMAGWLGEGAPARVALIRSLGAAEGLALNLHLARPVSTFDAHRLHHLAAAHGLADQAMEHLLHAYHTEGLNVADPQVLRRVGAEAGLPGEEVETLLAGDGYGEQVRADRRRAAAHGVTGVPSLVIGGGPPVSAVQDPAELRRLLVRAVSSPGHS
ncbi:DsbA family oxidoreductase [Nonomuraea spiralis]|uniref:DsbA family oxidoreductase n=1 Tax=Nonomuraea spiralis TaxID=46182 RepID=UPI0037AB01EF